MAKRPAPPVNLKPPQPPVRHWRVTSKTHLALWPVSLALAFLLGILQGGFIVIDGHERDVKSGHLSIGGTLYRCEKDHPHD